LKRSPYWILNRTDNELQMSLPHLDGSTLAEYVRMLEQFQPRYVCGSAPGLHRVARYLCEGGGGRWKPRAVFTEGALGSPESRAMIEEGFGTSCYGLIGRGEIGWIAVECRAHRAHILELSCIVEILDASGCQVLRGKSGRIVVTDLTQTAFPYLRYDTSETGAVSTNGCDCGLRTRVLEKIETRLEDLGTRGGTRQEELSESKLAERTLT